MDDTRILYLWRVHARKRDTPYRLVSKCGTANAGYIFGAAASRCVYLSTDMY
jgi:hypothetical protein